jgi:hypothetical protein
MLFGTMKLPIDIRICALSLLLAVPGVACTATSGQDTSDWPLFGEELEAEAPVSLASLLDESEANAGGTFVVDAAVESVCPKKGCWMMLADGDRTMRVTFKDYGFFVPMDIAGRTVRIAGVFDVQEVPVDEARHYLEDAGRHEEAAAITEPQRSFVFEATGVRVEPARAAVPADA